ncbi:hypothetical protein K523DRAFT_125687 [Schizophyllum commune Tattone D]|nr:hypothetical protein K523DRAFT_125687 [Schizophyllum commune Tattone D]
MLSLKDSLALSSTCRSLRWFFRPALFSTCPWKSHAAGPGKPVSYLPVHAPPDSVWCEVRHLYVQADDQAHDRWVLLDFLREHDLSRLESVHVRAEHLSVSLVYLLRHTPRLQTLGMGFLCARSYTRGVNFVNIRELEGFLARDGSPALVASLPRVLQYCSRVDGAGMAADECTLRMRGTRWPFVTLLRSIDVARIERLEVGAEALSLPIAAAYTWASLRELVVTRTWMHVDPQTPQDDARLQVAADAYEGMHLGTLLCAAPQLRVLRVLCWRTALYSNVRWMVWPPADAPVPGRPAMSALEEFELFNPYVEDGVYKHLPSTLRTLSLLAHPHETHETDASREYELQPAHHGEPHRRVLDPEALIHLLSWTSLPKLRKLCLSVRDLRDMRLLEYVAARFGGLEILELHDELGPGCIWNASKLAACAHALRALSGLRSLRLNTFRGVLSAEQWEQIQNYQPYHDLYSPYHYETPEQKARAGILITDIVSALFEKVIDKCNKADGAKSPEYPCLWPKLRDVWLPTSRTTFWDNRSARTLSRSWQIFDVFRESDGQVKLRPSPQDIIPIHVQNF